MDSVNIEEGEFREKRLACLQAGEKEVISKGRKHSERKKNCSGGGRRGGRKY